MDDQQQPSLSVEEAKGVGSDEQGGGEREEVTTRRRLKKMFGEKKKRRKHKKSRLPPLGVPSLDLKKTKRGRRRRKSPPIDTDIAIWGEGITVLRDCDAPSDRNEAMSSSDRSTMMLSSERSEAMSSSDRSTMVLSSDRSETTSSSDRDAMSIASSSTTPTKQREDAIKMSHSRGKILDDRYQHFPVRYHKMELMKSGAHGSIVRCFDHTTSQFVAIKEQKIGNGPSSSGAVTARGFHECTLVRFVNEPHNTKKHVGSRFVIEFVDQFTNPRRDSYYLVTPYYVRGDMIDFERATCGTPSFPQMVKDLFRDVLFGLCYLHRIGVAHRDLKPDNIFIHYDAALGRESAKIADFGLAAIIDPEHGALIDDHPGTVFYAAPEVFEGRSLRDPRPTDIWGFAASLYTVVYGWYPFVDKGVSVTTNMDLRQTRALYTHIYERVTEYDSNHLYDEPPAGMGRDILEVFSLCFVPMEERVDAERLLRCNWFRSLPSAQCVMASSCATNDQILDLSTFYRLNGYEGPQEKERHRSTAFRFRLPAALEKVRRSNKNQHN